MNLLTCRKDLAKELRTVCEDFRLKKPLSDESDDWIESGLAVFEQRLPPPRMDDEGLIHPFILVKATGGNVAAENLELGDITLIISTWDDDDQAGESDILNIIERIKNHFLAHPILSKKFYCQKDMSYELDDQDAHPYWYAKLTMTWEIPKTNIMTGADYV